MKLQKTPSELRDAVMSPTAVRSTEQVAISNRRSFEAGSRTLVDTLNAEQQKVSAQRDLARARFIYLISRVRLQALAGGPKTEVIDEKSTAGSSLAPAAALVPASRTTLNKPNFMPL